MGLFQLKLSGFMSKSARTLEGSGLESMSYAVIDAIGVSDSDSTASKREFRLVFDFMKRNRYLE